MIEICSLNHLKKLGDIYRRIGPILFDEKLDGYDMGALVGAEVHRNIAEFVPNSVSKEKVLKGFSEMTQEDLQALEGWLSFQKQQEIVIVKQRKSVEKFIRDLKKKKEKKTA